MVHVKLSNMQAQEVPLVLRERICHWEKSLLLHRMRFFGLYLHSEARAQEDPSFTAFRPFAIALKSAELIVYAVVGTAANS
jgi:hypothetical protein